MCVCVCLHFDNNIIYFKEMMYYSTFQIFRSADKSLAPPERKEAGVSSRMA